MAQAGTSRIRLSVRRSSPYERATHQHWVQTGPHVMVVGKAAREMASRYPRDVDVKDSSQPYVMFPGTPAEHVMLKSTS